MQNVMTMDIVVNCGKVTSRVVPMTMEADGPGRCETWASVSAAGPASSLSPTRVNPVYNQRNSGDAEYDR